MLIDLGDGTRRLGIRAVASELGTNTMSNFALAELCDTSDEWIQEHAGIRQRRISLPQESTSDLLVRAARRALNRARLEPADVDLLVVATITPDNPMPATSAKIHATLGLTKAVSFDMNAGGCANALYALVSSACLAKGSHFRNVLVVVGDKMSEMVDWTNRNCNYFFGDGAAAVVLSPVDESGLRMGLLATDGNEYETAWIPDGGSASPLDAESLMQGGNKIILKGRRIKQLFLSRLPQAVYSLLDACDTSVSDLDAAYFHQANLRVLEQVCEAIALPVSKTVMTVQDYGNTGGSSVLIALEHGVASGQLRPGDTVMLAAMGAGFQWGAMVLDWVDADAFHH